MNISVQGVLEIVFFEFICKNCKRHFQNGLKIVIFEEGMHVVYSRLINIVHVPLESIVY